MINFSQLIVISLLLIATIALLVSSRLRAIVMYTIKHPRRPSYVQRDGHGKWTVLSYDIRKEGMDLRNSFSEETVRPMTRKSRYHDPSDLHSETTVNKLTSPEIIYESYCQGWKEASRRLRKLVSVAYAIENDLTLLYSQIDLSQFRSAPETLKDLEEDRIRLRKILLSIELFAEPFEGSTLGIGQGKYPIEDL